MGTPDMGPDTELDTGPDTGPATGPDSGQHEAPPGRVGEVFVAFLRLGFTAFGGPIAHLGFFREEFVQRRRWLSEAQYGELVALCQFLPGPASSKAGLALGLMRAGWWGALAAFVAFTLPSALLMLALGLGAGLASGPVAQGALAGLKIMAVAIVAQAVWGMARSLCPDRARAGLAAAAVAVLALLPGAAGMVGAIALGAGAGLVLCPGGAPAGPGLRFALSRRAGLVALGLFALLLAGLPLLAGQGPGWAVTEAFFRAGALVFGGGHVVLPLLEAGVVGPGWVSPEAFLAGYGAAQAMPGPLFTFAAYLGAVLEPVPHGLAGAGLALFALFLPGFLLLIGVLPFWAVLRRYGPAGRAVQGANAAVVGILGAALYDPLFTTAITGKGDLALALGAFLLLTVWRAPPWAVVALAALAGAGGAALV